MVKMYKYLVNDHNFMGMIFLYALWSDFDKSFQEMFQKCLEQ